MADCVQGWLSIQFSEFVCGLIVVCFVLISCEISVEMWWPVLLVISVSTSALGASTKEPWLVEAEKLFGPANTTKGPDINIGSKEDIDLNPEKGSDDECIQDDGSRGVCVVYYQCDSETKNLITDGQTLIDIRINEERPCLQYLHVCCARGDVDRSAPTVPSGGGAACGYTNPGASGQGFRISNADYAEYAEFPWMLAVLKKALENAVFTPKNYLGGAALIHPKVGLTSAHKVDGLKPEEVRVRAGEWDTQTQQENYPYQELDVDKILVHEDFYRPSVLNSIALLIMTEPFKLAPHIDVVCLGHALPPPDTACFSMGWGKEDFGAKDQYAVVLKKVPVPLVSREKCQTALRGTRLGNHFVLHSSFACAGGRAGVDTCRGDGGSPLVCPINADGTRFAAVGAVAWGIGCGDSGVPGVYTDMTRFRAWVEARVRDLGLRTDTFQYTEP